MLPPAVCTSIGTEMAYPLSSTRYTIGNFFAHETFSDSQNSPSLVAPSPADTYTISSLSYFARLPSGALFACASAFGCASKYCVASAAPIACTNCVPVHDDLLTILNFGWPQWLGICRPPELGSSFPPTACKNISTGVTPINKQKTRSRQQ